MERIPITQRGYEALKKELEQLTSIERPQVIRSIEEARAHGDLSENAEYSAAKEKQSFIEGRINELTYKTGCAEIIDTKNVDTSRAVFGCVVMLENLDTEEKVRYQLLGPEEADIKKGRISIASPLGSAILGKTVGDEIVISTPGGKRNYEVLDISCELD
ncbi:MAG: transcription elongation factor GreA [Pseudomonadota bacterium]